MRFWPFIAAVVFIPFASAHAADRATGEQISEAITGNTVQGSMEATGIYTEYYAADGTVHGADYKARWSVEGDTMCWVYEGSPKDCWNASIEGDQIGWIKKKRHLEQVPFCRETPITSEALGWAAKPLVARIQEHLNDLQPTPGKTKLRSRGFSFAIADFRAEPLIPMLHSASAGLNRYSFLFAPLETFHRQHSAGWVVVDQPKHKQSHLPASPALFDLRRDRSRPSGRCPRRPHTRPQLQDRRSFGPPAHSRDDLKAS